MDRQPPQPADGRRYAARVTVVNLTDHNPYRSPTHSETTPRSLADALSPTIIRCSLIGTAVYVPIFLTAIFLLHGRNSLPTTVVATGVTIHFGMMIVNLSAFLFTIRDWRMRDFPTRWSKWGWLIGFIYTGGICWIWYIFKFNLLRRKYPDIGTPVNGVASADIK